MKKLEEKYQHKELKMKMRGGRYDQMQEQEDNLGLIDILKDKITLIESLDE